MRVREPEPAGKFSERARRHHAMVHGHLAQESCGNAAQHAELPGLSSFANGLQQDLDAVTAGLTSRWNSGSVEGRVNHTKMIKRQMFGFESRRVAIPSKTCPALRLMIRLCRFVPGASMAAEVSGRKVDTVPVSSLLPGDSPRLEGVDKAHVARLAEVEAALPPVLVDRRSMRVIDGMHRLGAALLKGQDTIDVEFFDGSIEDAFLRAVETNVRHGLPLSRADRRAAAARILASHPHMSDRAIAKSAGLSAKSVASIRQRSTYAVPQLAARVGSDGRVRPLDSARGRRRVAALLARDPDVSLREVARHAGVSPATAADVRKRLKHGDEPAPGRRHARSHGDKAAGEGKAGGPRPPDMVPVQPEPAVVLKRLLRDPSLRHNEAGRSLLRWLQLKAVGTKERQRVITAVPPHCTSLVVLLARHYAQQWLTLAQELNERAVIIDRSHTRQPPPHRR